MPHFDHKHPEKIDHCRAGLPLAPLGPADGWLVIEKDGTVSVRGTTEGDGFEELLDLRLRAFGWRVRKAQPWLPRSDWIAETKERAARRGRPHR